MNGTPAALAAASEAGRRPLLKMTTTRCAHRPAGRLREPLSSASQTTGCLLYDAQGIPLARHGAVGKAQECPDRGSWR